MRRPILTCFTLATPVVLLLTNMEAQGVRRGVELPSDNPAYNRIVSVFHTYNGHLERFELLGRKEIDASRSAVAVRATSSGVPAPSWDVMKRQECFGIFIISNDSDDVLMVVDTFPTRAFRDYEVTLVEATERYLTIAAGRAIAGGSKRGHRTRYFYDLDARKSLRMVEYKGVRVYSMFEFEGSLLFLGSDRNQSVVARLAPRLDFRELDSWEVVDRIGGSEIPVVDSVAARGETLALKGGNVAFVLSPDGWVEANDRDLLSETPDSAETLSVKRFGPWIPVSDVQDRMTATRELRAPANSYRVSRKGVYDLVRDTLYEFPRHDYEHLQKYRPRFAGQPDLERIYTICDMIGPYQFLGRKIWFGTTFPDAEGATGLGGIGFFDVDEKCYHMHYPKDLADWSTSSIWVGEKYAWVGLVNRSEYNRFPGGLLRYNVRSGETRKYDIDAEIRKIYGFGDDVFVGTSDGVYVISGEETTYVGFDFDIEGRYHLFLRRL